MMNAPQPPVPGDILTPAQVLAAIPQQEPFRFIDDILELDDDHIIATYRFRPEADFYRGHFPGWPITPGVLLIESMAQAGVVGLGIYLLVKERGRDAARDVVTVFTEAAVEFSGVVRPNERVIITGRKQFFRRLKLRSHVEMRLEDGTLVCAGELAGMGVAK
jgi:3-hydroxyacyl-[acyl-carrier-protein] dehydratase